MVRFSQTPLGKAIGSKDTGSPFSKGGGEAGEGTISGGSGSSGGSSKGGNKNIPPSVIVSGTEVIIDGVGYSVKGSDQEAFIKGKGGAISENIRQNIQAQVSMEQAASQAKAEQERVDELRKQIAIEDLKKTGGQFLTAQEETALAKQRLLIEKQRAGETSLTRNQYRRFFGNQGLKDLEMATRKEQAFYSYTGSPLLIGLEEKPKPSKTVEEVKFTPFDTGKVPSPTEQKEVPLVVGREEPLDVRKTPIPTTPFEFAEQKLEEARSKISAKRAREGETMTGNILGFGVGVASSVAGTLSFGRKLITSPVETVTATGAGLKEVAVRTGTGRGFPEFGEMLRRETGFTTGLVAGEVAQDVVLGKLASGFLDDISIVSSRLTDDVADLERISAKQSAVKVSLIDEGKKATFSQFDDIGDITKTKQKLSSQIGGTPKKELIFTSETVADLNIPLKSQLEFAGKQVDAVSAARDFFGGFDNIKTIDKPLPTPTSPILEKSLFADPTGKARISRLGFTDPDKASLIDILVGDVTFRKPKPQVLFFPDTEVEALPKNLQNIARKIKEGKTVTVLEQQKLLDFQLTPSGKFKPLGFLSGEPEITLAPTERVRKVGKVGKVLIGDKKVDIFQLEILKQKLDDVTNSGKKALNKIDDVSTGQKGKDFSFTLEDLKADLSSRSGAGKKFVSPAVFTSPAVSLLKAGSLISRPRPQPRRRVTSPITRRPLSPSVISNIISEPSPIRRPKRRPPVAPSLLSPPVRGPPVVPKPITPPLLKFDIDKVKPLKKKKRKDQFKDDLTFSPGFTATTLELSEKITKEALKARVKEGKVSGIGLRRIPAIID